MKYVIGTGAALMSNLAALSFAQAASFTFTTLDQPGQQASTASGIDAGNRVVGGYTDASGTMHGFVWSAGTFTIIDAPGKGTTLSAINSHGTAAGTSATSSVPDGVFSVLLATGKQQAFIADIANAYTVTGLNRAGVAVGVAQTQGFSFSAFHTIGRQLTLLSVPGAILSYASGINKGGKIAGQYADANYKQHGFTYEAGIFTTIDAGGAMADGTGLSFVTDAGVVGGRYLTPSCGGATCPSNGHGFVRQGNVDTTYDVPGSHRDNVVVGLGSAGEVVGNYSDPTVQGPENIHGFIYRQGAYYKIDVPGALYTSIASVNAMGSLAGVFTDQTGNTHGFVALCPGGRGGCVQ